MVYPVAHIPQQLHVLLNNIPRDEEIAAALRDVDIPHRLPLDPAAHQRAEKIPVRERIARKIYRADGRDGPLVPREPALVHIAITISERILVFMFSYFYV